MESNQTATAGKPPKAGNSSSLASSVILFGGIAVAALASIYLLETNPTTGTWQQGYDPMGNWWVSTALAGLPILVLLGAMAILRLKAACGRGDPGWLPR